MNHDYAISGSEQRKKNVNSVTIKQASSVKEVLRPKLKVGSPDDKYEREADQVAARVMTMPSPSGVQRKCSCGGSCSKCQRTGFSGHLQTKPATSGNDIETSVPSSVGKVLATPGKPLDSKTRAYFEPRFNHDFSDVKIHTGAHAVQSARDINARAYTVGNNIVFGEGESPTHPSGKKLLAHELTHVLQQRHQLTRSTPGLQRKPKKKTSINVWGLRIHRGMCGCKADVKSSIKWTRTAAKAYRQCNIPANKTGADVEACFDKKIPGTTVAGSTSAGGNVKLPPPSANPCTQIENKGTFVHETSHSRHVDKLAKKQGKAFYKEWQKLKGDPDRLKKMKAKFPAETAAHQKKFNEGSDWARDEVRAYRFERRFLQAASRALNKIC